MPVIYVSPTGQDSHEGTSQFPLQTITRALQQSRPGDIVQLAPGTYQAGERFPLSVPPGVTIAGGASQSVIIQGGGIAESQQAAQNVAMVLSDRAQIRDVTITNPQGSGILTTQGAALIVNNRLIGCQQHGVIAQGKALPFLSKNQFIDNAATGLTMGSQVKGEVRQNRFERNDYGLLVEGRAAPLVVDNQLLNNRCGMAIANQASPVLRKNQITTSQDIGQDIGLWVKDRAAPDIGHPQDLGHNKFEGKTYDIRNDVAAPLATAGNQINPIRVLGNVAYLPSKIPDPIAVPAVLLGNVAPSPLPITPPEDSSDPRSGLPFESRFNDLVGHWAAPFVEALAEKDLVKGFLDGSFQPDTEVTRAQFAALVSAAFPNLEASRPLNRFPDVPASFWGAQAIRHVQTRGFISGFPDGSFRPNAPMTRVQAIVALVNGLNLRKGRSESLLVYRDRAQVPSYAIEAIATATERQMVVSHPDPYSLRPLEPITRAETTALVHQALVIAGRTPRIDSPFIPQVDLASPNFTDLAPNHWAKGFIDPLVQKGWLSGFRDGTFRPDSPMTRAQFAALLVGAFDPQATRPAVKFRDVADDFWGAAVIQQAYRAQFISGFPDLTFDPNYPLTKLQALLALVSGLKMQAVSPANLRSLQYYTDQSDIPRYAKGAIATATQLGLVFNHPNLAALRPNRATTRAEVSAMVYQSLVLSGKMPAIPSPHQVSV